MAECRVIRSLVQFRDAGGRAVAALDENGAARRLLGAVTTLGLAHEAIASGCSLTSLAEERVGEPDSFAAVELLLPIDDPDPGRIFVKGTGLSHLGSAEGSNEFSDHVTERENYLWLAHSKLRQAGLGAELLLGKLPADVRGTPRILRGGAVLWEKPFLSGEANKSHTIANLEHQHFKNEQFRHPATAHVHFFGTATLSFSEGVETKEGIVFEIEADAFRLPVHNPLRCAVVEGCVSVSAL